MIRYFAISFLLLSIPFGLQSSFGSVEDFATDKSLYHQGDTLVISGDVSYDSSMASVIIQILDPRNSFADFNQFPVNSDGSFSGKFKIGPTWPTDGIYTIRVSYDGILEKTVKYQASGPSESEQPRESKPGSESKTAQTESKPRPETKQTSESKTAQTESKPRPETKPVSAFTTLKLIVPNFPALDKAPQHYIDRYNSEADYKSWFDSQFPSHSIEDVVGYKETIIKKFPALDKAPQYYIDRYNSEADYKSWFDSQFPSQSIYNVLGYENPAVVPDWVRSNAEWWATGEISDSTFVTGIKFMLENNIILISDASPSQNASEEEIPDWVRDNAYRWSQGSISEEEFVDSLRHIIREGMVS